MHDRLTGRDWQIIEALARLRVASGEHLERLFFSSLSSPRSRVASRSRALRRLTAWRVLVPLERRVGGAGRGSSGSAFALDSVGQKVLLARQLADGTAGRVRRPSTPSDRTLKHALAVSDLYVNLVELGRVYGFTVDEYRVEPRWPDGQGGQLGPDAYARLSLGAVVDHWWTEVDRATEDLETTLRRKLMAYLDFARRGQLGPSGVVPRVLVSCSTEARRKAVDGLVSHLPPPAGELFAVTHAERSAQFLSEVLKE
ncbi:replication-relaxation family protein [Phytohabitans suffuscus]|uniref:replication-relaxation family protein n=1 Tax=Phytohabitans suffuscus TaxID=624315 RepID=UPI0015652FBF|nr:replication-relaxation family protein [Phytohabitans suffuscus]